MGETLAQRIWKFGSGRIGQVFSTMNQKQIPLQRGGLDLESTAQVMLKKFLRNSGAMELFLFY